MAALAYNLTLGTPGGNAGPKPAANKPVHPSVGGRGPLTKQTSSTAARGSGARGGTRTQQIGAGPQTSPLSPISPNQIRQQATKAVQGAYAPAFNEIRSQQSRAQAIYDKQTGDNHYYLQWLATQTAALQAHNDASNAVLMQSARDLTAQQQQLYSTQPGSMIAAANAREGNVSNNAQSNAFNQQLVGNEQANEGLLTGTAQQALTGISQNQTDMANLGVAPAGTIMGIQSKENADLQTSLDKLRTIDTDLLGKQAADLTNAIQNAQKLEVAKAEYNQNTAIATQKLGIQAADTQSLIGQRAANTKIAQQNANTSAQRLQLSAQRDQALTAQGWARVAQSDRTYKLNVAKYNQSVAKDIYERNHHLGPYKTASGKSPYLGIASQNVIVKHIQSVAGQIDSLVNQGMSPQDAYHAIQRGYYVIGGKKYTTGLHEPDAVILNAALNTSSQGAGLSPGDVQTLVNEGIDPARLRQLLKEAKKPSPQGAASTVLNTLSNWG